MPEITAQVVEIEIGVRSIAASGKFTAKRVDHYTLESGGQLFRVTAYREPDDPQPQRGETIAGEMLELDKWDKDRFKFRVSKEGAGGSSSPGVAPQSTPAPTTSAPAPVAPPPPAAPALPLEERRRWLGFQTAALFAIARALNRGLEIELDPEDLAPVAHGLMRAASSEAAPFSDVPIDLSGLPGEEAAA